MITAHTAARIAVASELEKVRKILLALPCSICLSKKDSDHIHAMIDMAEDTINNMMAVSE